jgi:hypothetical protein
MQRIFSPVKLNLANLTVGSGRPLAVLELPVVFSCSALRPRAVLESPDMSLKSASKPMAVLSVPIITLTLKRALVPQRCYPLGSLRLEEG